MTSLNIPTTADVIERYRANYSIPPSVSLTPEMLTKHWTLETALRDELLQAPPDKRWEVFDNAYTTLYRELPWLNGEGTKVAVDLDALFEPWMRLIREKPLDIYEVGSGKAEFLEYLARKGHRCKATEITRERGAVFTKHQTNISWAISDGIHLDQFEAAESFDVVVSNQVIEHMHPDDVATHFRSAWKILRRGGRYVFATPQCFRGPQDVSKVFGMERPMGMHLKEYTHLELDRMLTAAGFRKVRAVLRVPSAARKALGGVVKSHASLPYLVFMELAERLLAIVPGKGARRIIAKATAMPGNVMMVATK